jgi:hypothetical protein
MFNNQENDKEVSYWKRWYLLVIGMLLLLIAFFAWFTRYFS